MWPLGQKNQHHLGICQKCTFQAPTQTHRIRNPGGGPSNLGMSRPRPPGDPDSAQVWEAWLSGLMATTSPQPDPRSHRPPHALPQCSGLYLSLRHPLFLSYLLLFQLWDLIQASFPLGHDVRLPWADFDVAPLGLPVPDKSLS